MPKRSTERDAAKAEYLDRRVKGEAVNLRELAGKLGVSYQTLRNWKAADKWDQGIPAKKRGGQPGNRNSRGHKTPPGATRARRRETKTRKRTELTAPSFLTPSQRASGILLPGRLWEDGSPWSTK